MSQVETYFRPPSEENSFIIRVMYGCPHNACTFCNVFKGVTCKVIPLEEVIQGLDNDALEIGEKHNHLVTSIYLEGGDPLAISSKHLLKVMEHAKKRFASLTRFAGYATAHSIVNKTQEELNDLAQMGLQRVFVGLESGSDRLLREMNKGATRQEMKTAGEKLKTAGIELDVSIIQGVGGKALSIKHAITTASLLNAIEPICVRIRTLSLKHGTKMADEYFKGEFEQLSPHEVLKEQRLMVEKITGNMLLLSEHWTDYVIFSANMPHSKEALLNHIDSYLAIPESEFKQNEVNDEQS